MTPDSWHAEAERILAREQRRPEPTGPTRCASGECGFCDDCVAYLERMADKYPFSYGSR